MGTRVALSYFLVPEQRSFMSRRHKTRKPAKHHTPAEKKHLRAVKRRSGPSSVRRRERRHEVLETLECGCVKTRVRMIPCEIHTVK